MTNIHIEELIPHGRDNAVTRLNLMAATGLNDREVRAHIEGARKHGTVIINLQNGEGYFQPNEEDYEYVQRQYNQQRSRAMKILAGNKTAAKWMKKIKGQMELGGAL